MYPYDEDPYNVDPYNYGAIGPYDINNLHQQSTMNSYNMPDYSTPSYQDPNQGEFDPNQQGIDQYTGIPSYTTPPPTPQPQIPFQQPYQTPSFGQQQQTITPSADTDAYMKRLIELQKQLYTPSTQASDRLNSLLSQFPERQPAGFGRKLVASMAGFGGGAAAADKILNEPYNQALASWSAKAGPFQSAATLENSQNVNERQLATSLATNLATGEKNQRQAETDKMKAQAAVTRANAYAAKVAAGPDAQVRVANGRVVLVDPKKQGPEALTDLGQVGSFNQMDIVKLQQSGAMSRAQVYAALAGSKEFNTETLQIALATFDANVQAAMRGMPNPTQVPEAIQNKIDVIYANEPQNQKYFENGDNGKLKLIDPPHVSGGMWVTGWGAVDQAFVDGYNAIAKRVYNLQPPALPTPPTAPAKPPQQQQQPTNMQLPGGKILQYSPSLDQFRYSTDNGKTWKILGGQ